RSARRPRGADELLIFFLREVEEPGEAHLVIAAVECAVKVPFNIVRQRDGQPRISAGCDEAVGGAGFESAVVPDEIDAVRKSRGVGSVDRRANAGLGAVQRRLAGRAEVKAIVLVVADGLIARMRA